MFYTQKKGLLTKRNKKLLLNNNTFLFQIKNLKFLIFDPLKIKIFRI